jgi:peptidoglycan L-alanyl-D-glutamate endopeptidase CwlK
MDEKSKERLNQLNPYIAYLGEQLILKCAEQNINIKITQGLRTYEEQNALYAQGRTTPGRIVTNAPGGFSIHNFGYAFDIVILDSNYEDGLDWTDEHYYPIGQIGKSIGLEWGGDFTSIKDTPHFQFTQGLTTAQFRAGERPVIPNIEDLKEENEVIEVPSNFNEKYYLFANQDINKVYQEGTLTDLRNHYITYGYKEGRSVAPSIPVGFNSEQYLINWKDVRDSGMSAENHYLNYGIYEGRSWFPLSVQNISIDKESLKSEINNVIDKL